MFNVCWAIGHWASTVKILKAIGVKNMKTNWIGFIDVTNDIKIRINALPAGCAKLAFCYAAIQRIRTGIFATFLPGTVSIANVIKIYNDVI